MAELASITAVSSMISSAINIGRILKESDKAFDKAEFKIQMVDLIGKLVDAKELLQSNREENISLREEIVRLKEMLAVKHELQFDGTKYWGKEIDGVKDGPFCKKCQDQDNKRIRLLKDSNDGGSYWHCTTCFSNYDVPPFNYRGPMIPDSPWT